MVGVIIIYFGLKFCTKPKFTRHFDVVVVALVVNRLWPDWNFNNPKVDTENQSYVIFLKPPVQPDGISVVSKSTIDPFPLIGRHDQNKI